MKRSIKDDPRQKCLNPSAAMLKPMRRKEDRKASEDICSQAKQQHSVYNSKPETQNSKLVPSLGLAFAVFCGFLRNFGTYFFSHFGTWNLELGTCPPSLDLMSQIKVNQGKLSYALPPIALKTRDSKRDGCGLALLSCQLTFSVLSAKPPQIKYPSLIHERFA